MPIDLSKLNELRIENKNEFRYQLISKLKNIAAKRSHEDFQEIISQFKKELITESYFYIDYLNEILRNIIIKNKIDFRIVLPELLFICQIGDHYSYDLLKKATELLKGHQKEMEELQLGMLQLEEQIIKLEEESEELRLYPMDDIVDRWLD